ncbi:MAG: stage II sporulation protein R, partial [Ruminiclostridium sp.]|nr:stage II sporulation protein R [Ruminiclostridium sp.]
RILTLSMLFGAAAAVLFGSFSVFARECEEMPEKLFRLHILANSDSEEDQRLKYALRDYLLTDMEEIFADCGSAEEAKEAARKNLALITEKSQQFVYDKGYDYTITASVENVYFTTRQYGGFTAPAGNYDALRILIGEGEGHNWWCVMFPPLCLGAVENYENGNSQNSEEELFLFKPPKTRPDQGLSEETSKRIEQDRPIQIKFALFEWLEKLF